MDIIAPHKKRGPLRPIRSRAERRQMRAEEHSDPERVFVRKERQAERAPVVPTLRDRSVPREENTRESYFELSEKSGLERRKEALMGSFRRGVGHIPVIQRTPVERIGSIRSMIGAGALIVFAVLLFMLTGLTSIDIFFWLFFTAMFVWKIDSRVAIGLALGCLVLIPVLLIAGSIGFSYGAYWAEQVAVWAYLFLVIGIVVQIVEYVKEQRGE